MTPQAPDELPKPPTPSERPLAAHSLVQNAGPLWDEATRTPFLEALAAGTLPVEAFRRWLAQDYLFAKDLTAFQSILLAKAPRDCHKTLVGGLGALDSELEWFESHAGRLQVDLAIPPHRICRRYTDFLLRCVHTEAYPVLIAVLFGVEASYLAAWSALVAAGLYAEFIARWSSVDFAAYVEALGGLADRYPHEGAQKFFNEVLVHEREFWQMSWQRPEMLHDALWRSNLDLARSCLAHPFVQALGDSSLSPDRFRGFVAQDTFFLRAFQKAYALALARSEDAETIAVFCDLIAGVSEELKVHRAYAAELRINLESVAPNPACSAYTDFLLRTAWQAPMAEIVAAMTPCMRLYAYLGGELVRTCGPQHPYRRWIEAYSGEEFQGLTERLEALLDRVADDRSTVRDSYRYALECELDFFTAALSS